MRPVVHIAETKDFSSEVLKRVAEFAEVKTNAVTQSELGSALNECDVFWFRLGFQIRKNVLASGVRCRFIVTPVTGLDHIDLDACQEANIKVLSLRGERDFLNTVRATAEHTLVLTLSLLRHISEAVSHVRAGLWNRDLFKGREVYGKTVGIIGVGRLGAISAGYFKALGAHVCGYDIKEFDPSVCLPMTLTDLLAVSDIVSVHLAYNPGTHHLVNKSLLQRMKPHSVIINTARGGIVRSEDLVWALKNNVIAGAALDVIENEYDRDLDVLVEYSRTHSNLIITPHIGGNTYESFSRTEMFLFEKLKVTLDNEYS